MKNYSWLTTNSDGVVKHILFEEISSFQVSPREKELVIFLKGNSMPSIFSFDNLEALRKVYNHIADHLMIADNYRAVF